MTKTNSTNETATNFKMPVKAHMPINIKMPVTVNFNSPINLTYNGATDPKPELEKVSASDLQKYIAERLQGQCETVNPRFPEVQAAPSSEPAYKYDTKNRTGIAEATIENKIMDEIVRRFSCRRDSLVSITQFKSCYDMYAVGTTGDVTYLVWRQKDGNLIIQRQVW